MFRRTGSGARKLRWPHSIPGIQIQWLVSRIGRIRVEPRSVESTPPFARACLDLSFPAGLIPAYRLYVIGRPCPPCPGKYTVGLGRGYPDLQSRPDDGFLQQLEEKFMLQQTKISQSRDRNSDPVSVRERSWDSEGDSTRGVQRSPVATGIHHWESAGTNLQVDYRRRPPHLHLTPPGNYRAGGKMRKYRVLLAWK